MKAVFEYLDYRLYLKDFYEEKKAAHAFFSYRLFGDKVGVDPSYLAKVLLGARHLADASIAPVAAYCGLKDKEAEYFEALVQFIKAKSQRKSRLWFEKLLSIKSIKSQKLLAHQYEYYKKWYHSAVRSVLEYHAFSGDFKALATQLSPAITVKEARESIALLEKLSLIRPDEKGVYRLSEAALTTGSQWQGLAIENFQEETLRLSRESLQRHAKELRDVSTVTLNINAADYAELRRRIKEFRGELIKYVNAAEGPDRTYQLNVQFFPLSKVGSL